MIYLIQFTSSHMIWAENHTSMFVINVIIFYLRNLLETVLKFGTN